MRSTIHKRNIRKQLTDDKNIRKCAEQCNVIGDHTKLKICYLLKHYPELDVSQIATLVGTTVSNTSHALYKLKSVELVSSRKESRNVYYSLRESAFYNIINLLENSRVKEKHEQKTRI